MGFINEPLQFTCSVSGGAPPYTYLWDFGDGNTSDESSPMHTYEEADEYDVTLTVTDSRDTIKTLTTTALIQTIGIGDITGGFGVSVELKNKLLVSKYVDWTIKLIGGSIPGFHIFKSHNGTILVKANSTETVTTSPFLALGRVKVKVTAEAAGEPAVTKTADAFALFFYVIIL